MEKNKTGKKDRENARGKTTEQQKKQCRNRNIKKNRKYIKEKIKDTQNPKEIVKTKPKKKKQNKETGINKPL